MEPFPARIHVLLASHAPIGLVLRRGPSRQVATLSWDRRRDRFEVGQWLKGRIFERRSDLSPDGKHVLYFARNGRWSSEAKGSWTAVSRAPYLKALALFPKGDCWHGGGLWRSARSYWLNDGCGHSVLRDTGKVRRDRRWEPSESFGGECRGVYYPRLLRDRWCLVRRTRLARWQEVDVFEKPLAHGWVLRKLAHAELASRPGRGCYWDEHQLLCASSGTEFHFPDWEWAELDGERLVWAAGGKLLCGDLGPGGLLGARELFDFNPMTFERIEAPY